MFYKRSIYEARKSTSKKPWNNNHWERLVAPWKKKTTYELNDYAIIGKKLYRSLNNDNKNKDPNVKDAWWVLAKSDVSTCSD